MEKGLIFVAMEMSSGDFRATELPLKGWWKGVKKKKKSERLKEKIGCVF